MKNYFKYFFLFAVLIFASSPAPAQTINAATAYNQTSGSQKSQQVDASGNVQPAGDIAARALKVDASATVQPVAGTAASGATAGGSPVPAGGDYNSSPPTFSNGQRGTIQLGSRGSQNVTIFSADSVNSLVLTTNNADGVASSVTNARAGVVSNGLYLNAAAAFDRVRGDVNGAVTQPYAFAASNWIYASSSGGISNTTTAVTIKTAAGGALKNCITHIDIDAGNLGAATEVVIRDGAGGTVLWRGFEGTGGGYKQVNVESPLCGTANTLLEAATLSATITGGVYVNVSGFTR